MLLCVFLHVHELARTLSDSLPDTRVHYCSLTTGFSPSGTCLLPLSCEWEGDVCVCVFTYVCPASGGYMCGAVCPQSSPTVTPEAALTQRDAEREKEGEGALLPPLTPTHWSFPPNMWKSKRCSSQSFFQSSSPRLIRGTVLLTHVCLLTCGHCSLLCLSTSLASVPLPFLTSELKLQQTLFCPWPHTYTTILWHHTRKLVPSGKETHPLFLSLFQGPRANNIVVFPLLNTPPHPLPLLSILSVSI